MSDASIKQALKPDRRAGKTQKELEADIERNAARQRRRKGEAAADGEEVLSIEDQIAEYEARLAGATPGSEEWANIWDTLQELRQRQEDGDP